MTTDGRPNIIYIFTDQQSYDALSCAGNQELSTPVRSAIAEPSNTVFLSAAVLWQIRIKQALG